jgi:vitamin B12 transporter
MWKPSFIGLTVAAALAAVLAAAPAAAPYFPTAAASKAQAVLPNPQHQVVVTATRIETPAREVASSVTVIAGADLDRTKATTVLEALRDVAGLAAIANGGPGSAASIFLRGANSEHVLVMLDGVELNDPMNPSRSFDFAHLGLDNVERVEVLRGPQSTLYGSDALGGVINILTRRGQGRPRLSLTAQSGSYGTLSNGLDFGGSTGAFHYSLGLSQVATRGFSASSSAYPGNAEKDGYRNLSLAGRVGLALKNGLEADLMVRAVSAKTDLDNFGGPGGDDPNNTQRYDALVLRGQARALFAGGRWEQKLGLSYVRSARDHDNPIDGLHPFDAEKGTYKSDRAVIDWQHNVFLAPSHTLTFGADISREQGESQYTSWSAYGPYDSPFPRRTADQAGIYVQDQLKIADRFFATVGARLDRHSRAGTALTYRLAPAYFVEATQTRLKATFGTGFKSPSLYQLYAPGTFWGPIGNAALKPEESRGWDAGVDQLFLGGALTAGATYFQDDFRNLIDFDFSRGYINIGRARTRGVEVFAEAKSADGILGRVSYTSLEAKDLDHGAALLRRPNTRLTARIDVPFLRRISAGVSAAYTGARHDRDFSSWEARDVVLTPYVLLDASLSYHLGAETRLFLRLDNILNAKYETVYGYGTARFSVYGGIKLGLI